MSWSTMKVTEKSESFYDDKAAQIKALKDAYQQAAEGNETMLRLLGLLEAASGSVVHGELPIYLPRTLGQVTKELEFTTLDILEGTVPDSARVELDNSAQAPGSKY